MAGIVAALFHRCDRLLEQCFKGKRNLLIITSQPETALVNDGSEVTAKNVKRSASRGVWVFNGVDSVHGQGNDTAGRSRFGVNETPALAMAPADVADLLALELCDTRHNGMVVDCTLEARRNLTLEHGQLQGGMHNHLSDIGARRNRGLACCCETIDRKSRHIHILHQIVRVHTAHLFWFRCLWLVIRSFFSQTTQSKKEPADNKCHAAKGSDNCNALKRGQG